MLWLQATCQRLSIGMTSKTLRLPKPGQMLLAVHGSPLGVYIEESMEALQGMHLHTRLLSFWSLIPVLGRHMISFWKWNYFINFFNSSNISFAYSTEWQILFCFIYNWWHDIITLQFIVSSKLLLYFSFVLMLWILDRRVRWGLTGFNLLYS